MKVPAPSFSGVIILSRDLLARAAAPTSFRPNIRAYPWRLGNGPGHVLRADDEIIPLAVSGDDEWCADRQASDMIDDDWVLVAPLMSPPRRTDRPARGCATFPRLSADCLAIACRAMDSGYGGPKLRGALDSIGT